jgi:hypothetical protein
MGRVVQRYYASTYGRFNTVDSGGPNPKDPVSWNRYSYTGGDPINRNDPGGSCWYFPDSGAFMEDWDYSYDQDWTFDPQYFQGGCNQGPEYEAMVNACFEGAVGWSPTGYSCVKSRGRALSQVQKAELKSLTMKTGLDNILRHAICHPLFCIHLLTPATFCT